MHVLILTHEFPPYIYGGIGTFCSELSEALGKRGIEVTVITGSPVRPLVSEQLAERVRVIRVRRLDVPPSHLWFQLMNQNAFKKLFRDVDVIHAQDISAFPTIYFAKKNNPKLPWVVTVHCGPVSEMMYAIRSMNRGGTLRDFIGYGIGFPVWDSMLRGDMKYADAIVPVSDSLSSELISSKYIARNRQLTIHTGVNPCRILAAARTRSFPAASNKIRMFWSGRHVWLKGILQLVEALSILKRQFAFVDFELNIFGHGPLTLEIRQSVAQLGLEQNVEFRGFVDYDEMLAWLASSDIVCFPSLYEACPLGMIEAMAFGKPIVAFDRSFAQELMGDDLELPFATTVDDLAKNLNTLSQDQKLRERTGETLRKRALNYFDIKIIAEQYAKLYETLLEDKSELKAITLRNR
jgi:glycosyltransferase involved in cell wall biosynthesis